MLLYKKAILVTGPVAAASGAGFVIYDFASAQQAPAIRFVTGDVASPREARLTRGRQS